MFNWFFALFAVMYFTDAAVHVYLDHLNLQEMQANKNKIPELFQNKISQDEYAKSIAYSTAKTHFGWGQLAFQIIFIWILILSGFFGGLDNFLQNTFSNKWLLYLSYPICVAAVFYIFSLPFSIYYKFGLEEAFGFNKSTYMLFFTDQLKTIGLSALFGLPLIALLFYLVEKLGSNWWLAGWGVMTAFQLLTVILFPVFLAPMFYKFTPLEDGELKDRITNLTKDLDFKMAGIYTIDGSKRSGHSNAFFAGLGSTRRIVLYDTIREQLSIDEIEAVIAHEIGHNKRNHILKQFLLSAILGLLTFYILGLCLKWPLFFQTFGVQTPSIYAGFVLFALFSGVFTFWLTPAFNYLSRKYEYEADAFAVSQIADRKHMTNSLINLSKENLSNLTPHPAYSFYHYSHPTTTERAAAIELAK